MVCVLFSSVVDHGFERLYGQAKDYTNGICWQIRGSKAVYTRERQINKEASAAYSKTASELWYIILLYSTPRHNLNITVYTALAASIICLSRRYTVFTFFFICLSLCLSLSLAPSQKVILSLSLSTSKEDIQHLSLPVFLNNNHYNQSRHYFWFNFI
jgi:hypothetical protein